MNEEKYRVIGDGLVYLDFGPVTMTLHAQRFGSPFAEAAIAGAEKVLKVFDEFVDYLDFLRLPISAVDSIPKDAPPSVRKMTESVALLGEDDFTSLAAVAGTASDFAVEAMASYGADYAIANNGGDVAWKITYSENLGNDSEITREAMERHKFLKVALIGDVNTGKITHSLKIRSSGEIAGLATSGMGGRSLTRGIASAVTALASDSSKADAAATAIANACDCDDPAIERCFAEELDYGTDIRGLLVTKSVGKLRDGSAELALSAGTKRAEELIGKGMIYGAVIFVAGLAKTVKSKEAEELFEIAELV